MDTHRLFAPFDSYPCVKSSHIHTHTERVRGGEGGRKGGRGVGKGGSVWVEGPTKILKRYIHALTHIPIGNLVDIPLETGDAPRAGSSPKKKNKKKNREL